MSDTIYAQSTPVVKAAIAVFRLSGPHVEHVASSILNKKLKPRTLELVELRRPDNGEVIDVCLAALFPSPASFTGEDVLELHTHGRCPRCKSLMINNLQKQSSEWNELYLFGFV